MTTDTPETTLADVLVFLADSLRPGFDAVESMSTLIEAALTFTRASAAGILLADDSGRLRVVASSSEQASEIEEAQLGADEGPCIDSFHTGRQVESARLADEAERWPAFVETTADRGFRAAHAFPLRIRDKNIGAMNLFLDEPGRLSTAEVAIVQALTGIVTVSILNRDVHDSNTAVAAQLQEALSSRVVIEQAKGVLMGKLAIRPHEAFELLRKQARDTGRTLGAVAEAVTERHAGA